MFSKLTKGEREFTEFKEVSVKMEIIGQNMAPEDRAALPQKKKKKSSPSPTRLKIEPPT